MTPNITAHDRWNALKDAEGTFKPKYPVKPCPVCGRPPVFTKVQLINRKHLEWMAVDYCGLLIPYTSMNISKAIAMWHEIVSDINRDFTKFEIRGYYHIKAQERAIKTWEAKYANMGFWQRLFTSIPEKPLLCDSPKHVPAFLKEREYYQTVDPL